MFYLDASVGVAAIIDEPHSERIWQWLRDNSGATICASNWVDTEVCSALSIKMRTGALDAPARADALDTWRTLNRNSLIMLPIADRHFRIASDIAMDHALGVRAGDALHLAIARDTGCTLVTLDRVMAEAAPLLGVQIAPL